MKILCIGDSLTYGYGVEFGCCWVDLIRNETGLRVMNFGTNGDTSGYMLERSLRNVLPYYAEQSDTVIIMGGANDCLMYGANGNDAGNILRIANAFQEFGCRPVVGIQPGFHQSSSPFFGPMDPEKLNRGFNEFADTVLDECAKSLIDCFDLRPVFAGRPELFSDGVHPTEEGHWLIAETVMKMLEKIAKKCLTNDMSM